MKLQGERSLSSIVEKFLAILVIINIVALIQGSFYLTQMIESTINMAEGLMFKIILLIYLSGFPALAMLISFLRMFNNIKKGEIFSMKNSKRLKSAYIASWIIGIIYVINVTIITLDVLKYQGDILEFEYVLIVFPLIIALVFLMFGVALAVLNAIYIKAIGYKQENELTI